jgi:hypothetical protein
MKRKLIRAYIDPETGCQIKVYDTPKPRRRKSPFHVGFTSCVTDFREKTEKKIAKLSMSWRAQGVGN